MTTRSPSITFLTCADPPTTCTLPCTGWSMTTSRPKACWSPGEGNATFLSLPTAATGATTARRLISAARITAVITKRLNIDAFRRPPEQREEDGVHDDEGSKDEDRSIFQQAATHSDHRAGDGD